MQIDRTTWRSPNHNARNERIRALVVHSCEGALPSPRRSSLPWLCNAASQVSCHYYVCRTGETFCLVDDDQEAWHAGVCNFGGVTDWNGLSIGIELEHRSGQTYPVLQKNALTELSASLIQQYDIAQGFIVTHRQIASPRGRKKDPSDWSDGDFALWAKSLYGGAGFYRTTHPQAIFEAPRGDSKVALSGKAVLSEGEVVDIDGVKDGFGHIRSGIGFVPAGILERV